MPDPAAASAAVSAAATATGLTVLGVATGLQADMLLAGVCGGVMAILTLRELTRLERLYAIIAALITSGTLGPLVVVMLPRIAPGLISIGDGSVVRVAVGFVIGFLAYRVLLPSLMTRAKHEIEERGK
jgi:hypothetical protein